MVDPADPDPAGVGGHGEEDGRPRRGGQAHGLRHPEPGRGPHSHGEGRALPAAERADRQGAGIVECSGRRGTKNGHFLLLSDNTR